MVDDKMIERINELAKKSRMTELDDEEIEEQRRLRQEYIDAFKRNMKAVLDDIEIVDDKKPMS